LVRSPPDRRTNGKYPVNTAHRSDRCKNVSLQCCLVATVIDIQSVRSQICVCIHMLCTMWRRWSGKRNKVSGTAVNVACQGKSFSVPLWARVPQGRYPSSSLTCDKSVTCETDGTTVDLTGSRASRHAS
jgi:hypothetical protein